MLRKTCPDGVLRPRGMTLIEILIVIVVIGVLAGLCLPVFSMARARAVQAVCKNHLKQMGLSVRLYLQYNENTYFPYAVDSDQGTLFYYGFERYSADGDGTDLDVTKGYLFPYYSMVGDIECCPAFKPPTSNGKKASGATLGYGYNRFGVAGRNANEVLNPENIVLFADCAHVIWNPAPRDDGRMVVEEFHYISPSDFTVHFRHAGEANVLFCDGHVESRYATRIFGNLPSSEVGMLNDLGDATLFIP